jgi:hypothetical protein
MADPKAPKDEDDEFGDFASWVDKQLAALLSDKAEPEAPAAPKDAASTLEPAKSAPADKEAAIEWLAPGDMHRKMPPIGQQLEPHYAGDTDLALHDYFPQATQESSDFLRLPHINAYGDLPRETRYVSEQAPGTSQKDYWAAAASPARGDKVSAQTLSDYNYRQNTILNYLKRMLSR